MQLHYEYKKTNTNKMYLYLGQGKQIHTGP